MLGLPCGSRQRDHPPRLTASLAGRPSSVPAVVRASPAGLARALHIGCGSAHTCPTERGRTLCVPASAWPVGFLPLTGQTRPTRYALGARSEPVVGGRLPAQGRSATKRKKKARKRAAPERRGTEASRTTSARVLCYLHRQHLLTGANRWVTLPPRGPSNFLHTLNTQKRSFCV